MGDGARPVPFDPARPIAGSPLVDQALRDRRPLVRRATDGLPVDVHTADGREAPLPDDAYDRVLVDAPCTGLGSLRRRPESRWRRVPSDLPPLTRLQRELLTAAIRAARPGGLVGYVTCSPHIVETQVTVTEAARRCFPSTACRAPCMPHSSRGR